MELPHLIVTVCFFAVAILYSSVGHGGASGYLAIMALAGVAPQELRPAALTLNIIVSTTAFVRFSAAGNFRWRLFWPFAAASVPAAFLAGRYLTLDAAAYRWVLGVVLIYAAFRLAWSMRERGETLRPPRTAPALTVGGGIGVLSGLIGVGGGIFLSPVMLLMRWATARQTAAVSALFILVNSISGLAGVALQHGGLPADPARLGVWAAAVLAGGLIGSGLGARQFNQVVLCRLLALVVATAGAKMFW
jgi:uncharacterized protein